jgi:hypothetical protein
MSSRDAEMLPGSGYLAPGIGAPARSSTARPRPRRRPSSSAPTLTRSSVRPSSAGRTSPRRAS